MKLWEPLWNPAIKVRQLLWFGTLRRKLLFYFNFIFSITRYHNIECATWATRLVCPVEVTGLANGLQNVYSGSVGKKIMGFI